MPLKLAELQQSLPPSTVGLGVRDYNLGFKIPLSALPLHPRFLNLMIIALQLLEKQFEVSKGTQVLNIFVGIQVYGLAGVGLRLSDLGRRDRDFSGPFGGLCRLLANRTFEFMSKILPS